MKFKTLLTTKLLESNLSGEEINLLPSSYQSLGDVCAIKLSKKLHKHKNLIGKAILWLFPRFKAVILQKNIFGELRKPEIEVIAGTLPKEIVLHENNCKFKFNPLEIMYSQGNHQEKKRLIKEIKNNEIVVDMFSGIGYFSIPIAKAYNNTKIFATEANPDAYEYLAENIRLNYLSNIVPIFGDCEKIISKNKIPKADRILMGLIPSCRKYIPAAMKIAKKGTVIHYHGLAKEKKEYVLLNDFADYKVRLLKTTIVKGYKPHINHIVLDLEVL